MIFNFVYFDYCNTEILSFSAVEFIDLFTLVFAFGDPIWKKAGYELSIDWELSILPIQRKIEAENNFKKGCQEYTEELNKEDFGDPDNHDSVITHTRARYPGLWSQMGLRKHHYERS